jgi:hypothetical protein
VWHVDVVDDEDGFPAAWDVGVVVSKAQGGGGGVVDVEGTREVEGVIRKWAVAGACEVEGVIDAWWGVNELFNVVGC